MHRYDIADAGQLAEASYTATKHPSIKPRLKRSLNIDDVQASFLDNGILLIPGSNGVIDYLKFNLRVLNIGGKRYRINDPTAERGASGTKWHQGFLRHAKVIYDWVEASGERPVYIIGHSLGAASAQILSKTWRVPAIGFAAPRPRKARGRVAHDDLCLCINRDDDLVPTLPGSFHHMGKVHTARAKRSAFGPDHHMKHYRAVVGEETKAGRLGAKWPV